MQLLDAKVAMRWFFDREHVIRRLSAGKRKALIYAGQTLRQRARDRLRKRQRRSRPGESPSVHATGFQSLRRIFYQWEPQRETLVVGPIKTPSKRPPPGGTVPEVLEFGGQARTPFGRVVDLAPRPFMAPTLVESGDLLVDFWSGVVTDG